MTNLRKLPTLEGKGTVEQKISLIVELLHSTKPKEAKYLIRTVLGDLKIGVGSGILRDAIVVHCFKPEDIEEKKKYIEEVQHAYDKATDFAEVFEVVVFFGHGALLASLQVPVALFTPQQAAQFKMWRS